MRTRPRYPRPKTKRVGRPTGSFTQHRRLDGLREALEAQPAGLTLEELAAVLFVTERSVRRYLKELEAVTELDWTELPGGTRRWRLKPTERSRAVPLRRSQAYGLAALGPALEALRGSALFEELDLALGQILRVAQRPIRSGARGDIEGETRLERRLVHLPPPARASAARGEELDDLFTAVANLRVVRFRPRARAGEPRADRVTLHPYGMVLHEGSVTVVGRALERDAVEAWPFDRTSEVRLAEDERFELPETFDLSAWLHGGQGVAPPTGAPARAIVEFDAAVADEVRARRWHPQQKVGTSPDGRVRLQLPIVDRERLARWVLGFGDRARVVEPADLADAIAERLGRAAQRYGR